MLIEKVELGRQRPDSSEVFLPVPAPGGEPRGDVLERFRREGSELLEVRSLEAVGDGSHRAVLGRTGVSPLEAHVASGPINLAPGRFVLGPASRDWLKRKSYFVGGLVEWDAVDGTDQEWSVEIPLLRLHRPDFEGCEAKYSLGRATSTGGSFKFTFGVGIGGEATITAKATETYVAAESCVQVLVTATLATALFTVRINGEEVRREWDATVVAVDDDVRDPGAIPGSADECGQPYAAARGLPQFRSWDLSQDGDPALEESIELSEVCNGTLGLELEAAPFKLEVGLERETSRTTAIETSLAAGRRYSAYVPPSQSTLERCWTADLPG